MSKFTIEKSQVTRLKVLNDYVKKMESISPLNDKMLFTVEQDKLHVYGDGNASFIQSTYDIKDVTLDKINNYFMLKLDDFIKFIEKERTDETVINSDLAKSSIVFGKTSKNKYKTAVTEMLDANLLTEKQNNIKTILAKPEFKTPIEINLKDYINVLADLASLTKLLDVNQQILLEESSIKVADNICVINYKTPKKAITTEDIYINHNVVSLFKGTDNFKLSSDKQFLYFDVSQFGIQIIFVQPTSQWQYPSQQDIDSQIPLKNQQIELEVNAKEFYDVLDDFAGVFDSTTWKYHQMRVNVPKAFKGKLEFNFDNMANTVDTELNCKILSQTDKTDGFQFVLPGIHFPNLKDILFKDDTSTFKLIFDSIKPGSAERNGIVIENNDIYIMMAKMVE